MLITYTCGGLKSNVCAYTQVAYTCGGQKSNGCAYTLVAYTCSGQKSREHPDVLIAYTVGKSLMVVLTRWSHTPAVGKSLGDTPTR